MNIPTAAMFVGCLVVLSSHAGPLQDTVDGFAPRTFKGTGGVSAPYRLFVPEAAARVRPLPMILYLHGGGGVGTDNVKQISGGNTSGTHVWTTPDLQRRHPAFVVAPQIPAGEQWHARGPDPAPYTAIVVELLASLAKEFSIDQDRVYVVGQSLGGYGTWDVISKRPHLFAAAVPLCGGGNPARVAAARDLPVWAFHGAKDQVVPVTQSRDMVAALRAAGGSVKYTEYPDAGHDIWTRTFTDRGLHDWLFAQRRGRR
jgi:predicted peptidase